MRCEEGDAGLRSLAAAPSRGTRATRAPSWVEGLEGVSSSEGSRALGAHRVPGLGRGPLPHLTLPPHTHHSLGIVGRRCLPRVIPPLSCLRTPFWIEFTFHDGIENGEALGQLLGLWKLLGLPMILGHVMGWRPHGRFLIEELGYLSFGPACATIVPHGSL